MKLRPEDKLRLDTIIQQKKLGLKHILYQQYYNGIKVLYGTYAVHAKKNIIETINGHFIKVGTPPIQPQIDEQNALSKALKVINTRTYGWQNPNIEKEYKKISKDPSASLYPKGELVILYDDSITHSYRLAFSFHIYSMKPLRDNNVFVDAISGDIIGIENLIRDGNATGTAATKYSDTQIITTDSYSGGYRLREVRNGVHIQTFNMQKGSSYNNATDFSDNNNNWTTAEYHNTNQDDADLDVHWGMEKVYDYWHTIRQRNSWNDEGATLTGYVHADLIGMGFPNNDNAFWDPTFHRMTYGDGQTQFNAVTSLDVIAHETGHGFTEGVKLSNGTSILSSQTNFETPALNEGISDIWGAVIEHWAAPNKQTWEIGEDIMKNSYPCLRSLANPETGGDPTSSPTGGYPTTYHGSDWYNGSNESVFAHVNSTVLSHWFYLLSEGGSGVDGIGITEAASIVWQAEKGLYLQPASNYATAREAMIAAAIDLYDANSCEAIAVTNAWHAVGVGDEFDFKAAFPINGPSWVCTNDSATYTTTELPDGTSVTWSASPSGIASLTPNGNQVMVTRISPGEITLTANITSPCSNETISKVIQGRLPVIVGGYYNYDGLQSPLHEDMGIFEPYNQVCYSHSHTIVTTDMEISGATSIVWSKLFPIGPGLLWAQVGDNLTIHFRTTQSGIFKVEATNACGTVLRRYSFKAETCSNLLTIWPNPAKSMITIMINNEDHEHPYNYKLKGMNAPLPTASDVLSCIRTLKIYDASGKLSRQQQFAGKPKQVHMNISGLAAGIYFIEISDGKHLATRQIVIEN